MTSILEKTISIIAPTHCILCSTQNNVLCEACFGQVFGEPVEACFVCGSPSRLSEVCQICRPRTALSHLWAAAEYDGVVKDLIKKFKFERLQAAAGTLAQAMLETLPYLEDRLVVPVPTAPSRVRMRGYDQTLLLAKQIAKDRQWPLQHLLRRQHDGRQVGATRSRRYQQSETAFRLKKCELSGKKVLLVDDVTTSGATLQAAAKLLQNAGAAQIDAVVIAKQAASP